MAALRKTSPAVVKIPARTHAKLAEISREEDRPMGEIVADLVDRLERERFWLGAREDLARLKSDPVAWQGSMDEAAFFERSAGDGLEGEPPYYTPEEERDIFAESAADADGR